MISLLAGVSLATLALLGVGPAGGNPIPSVIQTATSTAPDTFDTTKSITLPATITAGSKLLCIINETNQSTTPTPPSGWTLVSGGSETSTANKLFLYEKTASGSEGGTTLTWTFSGNCIANIHFYELSLPNNQIEVTFATATDDPPNHTPSAGTNDYIFIAVACSRQNTMNADAAPLGYSNLIYTESSTTNSSSNGEVAMATARVFKNAVPSENPDPFTWTGARTTPIAATISCR